MDYKDRSQTLDKVPRTYITFYEGDYESKDAMFDDIKSIEKILSTSGKPCMIEYDDCDIYTLRWIDYNDGGGVIFATESDYNWAKDLGVYDPFNEVWDDEQLKDHYDDVTIDYFKNECTAEDVISKLKHFNYDELSEIRAKVNEQMCKLLGIPEEEPIRNDHTVAQDIADIWKDYNL